MHDVRRHALVLALAAILTPRAGSDCLVDQSQELYDSGTSARTLPGYTIWQSFTPSSDGALCGIDMGFFNDMSGSGTLTILEGDGTSGATIWEGVVPIVGATMPGPTWNAWPVSASVSGGVRYTFRITPDAATLPDPYGVCAAFGDPYADGRMGLDDPSGSYEMPFDMVFRAHLEAGAAPADVSVYRDAAPESVDDPAHEIARVLAGPYDDASPPSARVLFYEVEDVAATPGVLRVARLGPDGVRLSW